MCEFDFKFGVPETIVRLKADNDRLRTALSGLMNYIFDVGGFPRFEASHGAAFDAAYLAAEAALRPSQIEVPHDER